MYSSIVFIMSATAFVCVQCTDVRSKKAFNYTEVSEVDCNPEHKEGLQNAIKNTRCQPYNRSVALKPMSGQIFNPPSVSVPQCDGIVAEGHVCAPTETKIIQVPVSVSTSGRSNPKCALVNVVEHIKCMPKCKQGPEDCKKEEAFDGKKCKCICKNEAARKQKCIEPFVWNDKNCECTCKTQKTECTTGLTWKMEHCGCV